MTAVPTVVVSPMTPDHIEAVTAIDSASFSRPWSRAQWLRELEDRRRVHLVAELDGRVIGHGGLMLIVDEAHLTTVATDPEHRRQGVARRLVYALVAAARARDARAMTLEVRASERGAQRLYSSFGFMPVGLRRQYYSAPSEDAVVMWLDDLDGDNLDARLARLAPTIESPS